VEASATLVCVATSSQITKLTVKKEEKADFACGSICLIS